MGVLKRYEQRILNTIISRIKFIVLNMEFSNIKVHEFIIPLSTVIL